MRNVAAVGLLATLGSPRIEARALLEQPPVLHSWRFTQADEKPDTLLKRVRENVSAAKGFEVNIQSECKEGKEVSGRGRVRFVMFEEKKIRLEIQTWAGTKKTEDSLIIHDGTRGKSFQNGVALDQQVPTPMQLLSTMNFVICATGYVVMVGLGTLSREKGEPPLIPELANLRFPDEKPAQANVRRIEYDLEFVREKERVKLATVTVWIDTQIHLPVRRTADCQGMKITELYEWKNFGHEPPEKEFLIPSQK